MRFAFQKMQLEAPSLYALIDTWAEMQLEVTDSAAVIKGYGFSHEIAKAFTTLVLDWEAKIFLARESLSLDPGTYDLVRVDEALFACRDQQKYLVTDRGVAVEVQSVIE